MLVDALVLTGGRSSRLGGAPKAGLRYRETTLLERALSAVSAARRVAVVGVADPGTLPDGVVLTREDPAFGGPAAAIAAGLSKLAEGNPNSDFTIVVACDMPAVGEAIGPLLQRLAPDGEGVIAVDPAGRLQPLAAVYRTAKLAAAAAAARAAGQLDGLPTFQLIAGLHLTRVPVPSGATDDVDTWADAERLGVARPGGDTAPAASANRHESKIDTGKERHIMSVEERSREGDDEALQEWAARLAKALGLEDFEVDLKTVLGLAGRAAHAVLRPAAPLTTYVVGYAAGLAAGSGSASSAAAVKSATDIAFQLCREEMAATGGAPDPGGHGSHPGHGQHPEP